MKKIKIIKAYLILFSLLAIFFPLAARFLFGNPILGVYIFTLGVLGLLYLPILFLYLDQEYRSDVFTIAFFIMGFVVAFMAFVVYTLSTENWFGSIS